MGDAGMERGSAEDTGMQAGTPSGRSRGGSSSRSRGGRSKGNSGEMGSAETGGGAGSDDLDEGDETE